MERATSPKYDEAAKTAGRVGSFKSGIYKGTRHEGMHARIAGDVGGKLAAEENHFEGLAVLLDYRITDFNERAKEVGEVIQALRY